MSEPSLLIKPETVACPAHGEHLRANWPRGFAAFSMTIVQAAMEGRALHAAAGAVSGSASVDEMNRVLSRRPLCYFVDRQTIQTALLAMGTLGGGLCQLCGRSNIGGAYTVDMVGSITELPHVCVNCALDLGDKMHRTHPRGGVWHD